MNMGKRNGLSKHVYDTKFMILSLSQKMQTSFKSRGKTNSIMGWGIFKILGRKHWYSTLVTANTPIPYKLIAKHPPNTSVDGGRKRTGRDPALQAHLPSSGEKASVPQQSPQPVCDNMKILDRKQKAECSPEVQQGYGILQSRNVHQNPHNAHKCTRSCLFNYTEAFGPARRIMRHGCLHNSFHNKRSRSLNIFWQGIGHMNNGELWPIH